MDSKASMGKGRVRNMDKDIIKDIKAEDQNKRNSEELKKKIKGKN
jgi:hypothetical protein